MHLIGSKTRVFQCFQDKITPNIHKSKNSHHLQNLKLIYQCISIAIRYTILSVFMNAVMANIDHSYMMLRWNLISSKKTQVSNSRNQFYLLTFLCSFRRYSLILPSQTWISFPRSRKQRTKKNFQSANSKFSSSMTKKLWISIPNEDCE